MPPLDLSILLRFHLAGKTPEEKRIKRRALPLNAKWGRGGAGREPGVPRRNWPLGGEHSGAGCKLVEGCGG